MGKDNKARRAAKARSRAKARAQFEPGSDRPDLGSTLGRSDEEPTKSDAVRGLLLLAARSRRDRTGLHSEGIRRLVACAPSVVDPEIEAVLLAQVDQIWKQGWQPGELLRQARMKCPAAAASLIMVAVAVDHNRRPAASLDRAWRLHVEGLKLPDIVGNPGWLQGWVDSVGLDRTTALHAVVDALAAIGFLPRLEPILRPPGGPGERIIDLRADGATGSVNDPVLERIRALLAKAESTSFEAEASAYTAKAQELMTRRSIDPEALKRQAEDHEKPIAVRIAVDPPYADIKTLLLQTVAGESRCRAAFRSDIAMSTVVGFCDDINSTEMLFTSLLLQAQAAMAHAGRNAPSGTRTRSASYRSSFLFSYTDRIGERLRQINEEVISEVEREQGALFLPVLRSREHLVDGFASEKFGPTASSRVRGGYDYAGQAGGRQAADQASLNFGALG